MWNLPCMMYAGGMTLPSALPHAMSDALSLLPSMGMNTIFWPVLAMTLLYLVGSRSRPTSSRLNTRYGQSLKVLHSVSSACMHACMPMGQEQSSTTGIAHLAPEY